ncbi:hypothetical protein A4G19_00030 [Pasteurellaceae bacterium Macca]|nr:hypothetical protein [Pasteurellaceae bacterium Macca]
MPVMKRPDEQIFASSAKDNEVQTFPNLTRGWGISFEQTQGIPPMEWFNFLFKRLDEALLYHLQRGLPEWSANTDYPQHAFVQHQGKTYRALRANKKKSPDIAMSADWVQWAGDYSLASLTQKGIVQLSSETGSNAEDKAATPKAVKTVKDLIDALNRNLSNYIPNSKKSSATNSASNDTVATSAAVKAVNDNANSRFSKQGGEVSGRITIRNGDYSGIDLMNDAKYRFILETKPHNNNDIGTIIYRNSAWENEAQIKIPKKTGTLAIFEEVLSQQGGTLRGILEIDTTNSFLRGKRKGNHGWYIGFQNSESDDAYFYHYIYETYVALKQNAAEFNKNVIAPDFQTTKGSV